MHIKQDWSQSITHEVWFTNDTLKLNLISIIKWLKENVPSQNTVCQSSLPNSNSFLIVIPYLYRKTPWPFNIQEFPNEGLAGAGSTRPSAGVFLYYTQVWIFKQLGLVIFPFTSSMDMPAGCLASFSFSGSYFANVLVELIVNFRWYNVDMSNTAP